MEYKKHVIAFFIIGAAVLSVGYFLDKKIQQDFEDERYRLEILKDTVNKGWYYEIYIYDDLAVRQMFMPGLALKHQFLSKEDAEKVGKLVIEKMSKGSPPNISQSELDDLQVSF